MNLRSAALLAFIGMTINMAFTLLNVVPNMLGMSPLISSQQAQLAIFMVQILVGQLPLIVFFLLLYTKQKKYSA